MWAGLGAGPGGGFGWPTVVAVSGDGGAVLEPLAVPDPPPHGTAADDESSHVQHQAHRDEGQPGQHQPPVLHIGSDDREDQAQGNDTHGAED